MTAYPDRTDSAIMLYAVNYLYVQDQMKFQNSQTKVRTGKSISLTSLT